MAKIKLLSRELIDQIAAGEVVVNAAGAIKELIENSLDANSKNITIETRGGGKSSIRIVDDGCGIEQSDIPLVFVRNATSKIADDLSAIETLGFRGEALASISFVSHITLTTKTAEDVVGTKVLVEKNEVVQSEAAACRVGTIIEITDLFYNTPARLKYLKKDSAETAAIIDLVGYMALSRPDVRFSLICDGREIFSTDGKSDVLNTAAKIYGRNKITGLMKCEIADEPLFVSGYITSSAYSDDRSALKLIYINSRYVKSEPLSQAVEQVYKELFAKNGAGYILYIRLPAEMLDVNIHPAKLEVKLYNASLITMLIKQGIRSVLREEFIIKDSSPKKLAAEDSAFGNDEYVAQVFETAEKYFVGQPDKPTDELTEPAEATDSEPITFLPENEPPSAPTPEIPSAQSAQNSGGTLKIDSRGILLRLAQMKYIGNAFSQYALIECGSELYAMDIHAAHERVLYDKFLKDYQNRRIALQPLMVPVVISPGGTLYARALAMREELGSLGFEVDDFGGNAIAVRSIPAELSGGNVEQIVLGLLNALERKTAEDIGRRSERLIKEACHHAVRGEADINEAQVRALLTALYDTDMPFTCPHGRTILGRLDLKYFMKAFDRI